MTDAAPDNHKRAHGVLWYVAWLGIFYVLTFPVFVIAIVHFSNRGTLPEVLSPLFYVMSIAYAPLWMILRWVGLEASFKSALGVVLQWLNSHHHR